MKKISIIFTVAVVVTFLVYSPILKSFFEQDEWAAFGIMIKNSNPSSLLGFIFNLHSGHYIPFGRILGYLEFKWFNLNFLSYALTSLILHLISVILIYFLAIKLFNQKTFALITSLIFLLADYGYQVVSWPAGNFQNQISVTIALLLLLLFIKFLRESKNKFYWISWILLIISLLTKENAIAFFILLPIMFFLFANKNLKKKYFYPAFIFSTGIIYGLFRVVFIFTTSGFSQTAAGSQTVPALFYNLITFPIKAIVQTIIPVGLELSIAKSLALHLSVGIRGKIGTTAFDIFVQQKMLEILSFIIFLIIIGIAIFIYKKIQNVKIKKTLVFGFAFIVLNSFIYALSPERIGTIPIIDSRNLYFLTIGSSIVVAIFAYVPFKSKRVLGAIFIILFFGINIYYLNRDISLIQAPESIRINILNQIKKDYPKLPRKVVVYTESDSSFYGLPVDERILPFQSGFGEILLVWYENTNQFPPGFFGDSFLWPIKSEGYREINDVGFGYFINFDDLANFFNENKTHEPDLIAYSFDSKTNTLTNITTQIRGRIDGYEARKRVISPDFFKLSATSNNHDIKNIIDGNPNTFWDSKVTYDKYQYITINIGTFKTLCGILIQTSNPNQNQVGYKVVLSNDGVNWKEVFSANRYPPGQDGQVRLYFEPTDAKFVRIEQIGYHKYASWVISGISVYEKY